jgi:hypothetical protein
MLLFGEGVFANHREGEATHAFGKLDKGNLIVLHYATLTLLRWESY